MFPSAVAWSAGIVSLSTGGTEECERRELRMVQGAGSVVGMRIIPGDLLFQSTTSNDVDVGSDYCLR